MVKMMDKLMFLFFILIFGSLVVSDGSLLDVDYEGDSFTCDELICLDTPPDDFPRPPPIPLHIMKAIKNEFNKTNDEEVAEQEDCGICEILDYFVHNGHFPTIANSSEVTSDSWLTIIVVTTVCSLAFLIFLLIILVKFKNWKIFPVSDSCPILPESFLGGHKSAPPPCSPTDSCISPVVNEKSPQSVIIDEPTKKTSISSKYWKRGPNVGDDRLGTDVSTDMDPYSDAASCTSSPVYAELDPAGVTHALSTPTPIILGGSSISPYAVCNTYSEVADAVRMAALGSSSALLPDASYDNAAYLPSNNPNQHIYQSRSLRRAHRAATLGQLGSATPLLRSHYNLSNPTPQQQLNYLTGGRPQKKPRPFHSQINARSGRLPDDLQSARFERHGIYSDLPTQSPTLTTFRTARHALRDNPKRPLPPVPGVRL
ncbi:uncharacterized protein LOC128952064 [Oppia nitens]|uniref:uncharacterized protein LOC128952064 n=1 Tax=Oppia nitens TaxID=1686743 RepID=UPI0023DACF41|nr:uncharacterized protein LOC128952064 [Oppia nitens]